MLFAGPPVQSEPGRNTAVGCRAGSEALWLQWDLREGLAKGESLLDRSCTEYIQVEEVQHPVTSVAGCSTSQKTQQYHTKLWPPPLVHF